MNKAQVAQLPIGTDVALNLGGRKRFATAIQATIVEHDVPVDRAPGQVQRYGTKVRWTYAQNTRDQVVPNAWIVRTWAEQEALRAEAHRVYREVQEEEQARVERLERAHQRLGHGEIRNGRVVLTAAEVERLLQEMGK